MKFWLNISLMLIQATTLFGQENITGKVFDRKTGEPLAGATVKLIKGQTGTITDVYGDFSIDIPEGFTRQLAVSYVGYEPQTVDVLNRNSISVPLESSYTLDEIVIQAVRGTDNRPSARDLITRKEIDQIFTGQDAIYVIDQLSPSILTYSESGSNITNYGLMRMRGIDQSRINMTLDGTPLNDMIDQGVFFSNFTDFANSIESIQVERGVGTSMNGTASYAGSIDFESVDLSNRPAGAELQLTGGSFGTIRGSIELTSGMLADKFNFYTRFTKTHTDGYRYHSGTDSYSFFFSGGYFGERDVISIKGFTGKTRNGLAYLPVAISDIEKDPRTNYVNENDVDNFGQDFLQLQYVRSFSDYSSLVSTAYYGAAGGDFPAGFFIMDSIYSPGSPGDYELRERLVQINYPLYNDHYGFISYFNHRNNNGRLRFNSGIHLYTFQRQNLESILPDNKNPYYSERSWKNELSLFLKAEYQIERLSLFADIQFRTLRLGINPDDRYLPGQGDIYKKWTFFNPKIGLTYSFDLEKNIYIYYGFSGREPTKIDIFGGFQLTESNLESVLSDDVKPEYVNDLEAGFRMDKSNFEGQVNIFYMRFRNEIAPIGEYVPEGFIQLRKNIPASYRTGIEMNWLWRLIPSFIFKGDATYMKSRIKEYAPEEDPQIYTNVTQPFSPDIMLRGAVVYEYKNLFDVELSGRYVSESFLEPTNQMNLFLPSFFVADFRFGINYYKLNRVEFFMNNVFNKQYFTYGAPVDPSYNGNLQPGYFVQAPRNFFLQLVFKL